MNGRTQLIDIVKDSAKKRIKSAWQITIAVCVVYIVLAITFAQLFNLIGIPYTLLVTWLYIRSIKKSTIKRVNEINAMYYEHENQQKI